jgi:hypothetical protein
MKASAVAVILALAGRAEADDSWPYAAGLGVSAYAQDDQTLGYIPELVGYGYLAVGDRWFVRPGLRLWVRGLDQAEMAGALALTEYDLGVAGEAAITYSGRVVPALAIGASLAYRRIASEIGAPIEMSDTLLDRSEMLWGLHAQLSVGLPVASGRLMIEPFVRYELVPDDERLGLRTGIELTIGIGQ